MSFGEQTCSWELHACGADKPKVTNVCARLSTSWRHYGPAGVNTGIDTGPTWATAATNCLMLLLLVFKTMFNRLKTNKQKKRQPWNTCHPWRLAVAIATIFIHLFLAIVRCAVRAQRALCARCVGLSQLDESVPENRGRDFFLKNTCCMARWFSAGNLKKCRNYGVEYFLSFVLQSK